MILFFAGLILSVPIGVVVNLFTPWVRLRFVQSNVSRNTKKLEQIVEEFNRIATYRNGPPNRLVAYAVGALATVTFALVTGATFAIFALIIRVAAKSYYEMSFSVAAAIMMTIILIVAGSKATKLARTLEKIHNFEQYGEWAERKEQELQGLIRGSNFENISEGADSRNDPDKAEV